MVLKVDDLDIDNILRDGGIGADIISVGGDALLFIEL